MKCHVARPWLAMCEAQDPLPKPVRRHLRECGRCRKRYRRLLRLEAKFKTDAPACDASLRTFLDGLATLPQQQAAASPSVPIRSSLSARHLLYWAAAILFIIGLLGILAGQLDSPDKPPVKNQPPIAAASDRSEDQLLARFVQRDLVLANTMVPVKQWQVLSEMADDLRSEALRLSDERKPDDLPMVVSLYERVLQRGLVGRADKLPEKEKSALLQGVAARLRSQDQELEQKFREATPDWLTLLQPIQKATRQTANVLAGDTAITPSSSRAPIAMPGGSDYRRLLLSALVLNGLQLVEETDPLKRADCCSDLAGHLLQALVTASVKGDERNAAVLGKHLGEFVERGVSVNLARVPSDDPRVTELKEVMLRTNQILLALDRTMEQLTSKQEPNNRDPVTADRVKELEKMLKDVEKSLKRVHKAFKEAERGKEKDKDKSKEKDKNKNKEKEREKEKDHKSKGKGKGKGWSELPMRHDPPTAWIVRAASVSERCCYPLAYARGPEINSVAQRSASNTRPFKDLSACNRLRLM